jgi:hypothetical protein
VPLSRASSDVPPPITGPIESTATRWPMVMPSAANGISPTMISPVMASHSPAGRRTPNDAPKTYRMTRLSRAIM